MKRSNASNPLKLFLSLSRDKGLVVGASIALIIATLLHLAFAYMAGGLVDTTMDQGPGLGKVEPMVPGRTISEMCVILVTLVFVVVAFSWMEYAWFTSCGERAISRLRRNVFSNLVKLPMNFFHRNRGGELSSHTLADVMLLQEFWVTDLRLILKSVLLIAGGVAMLFFLSVKLALVAIIAFPLVAAFSAFLGRKIRGKTTAASEELARSSVVVEEAIRGILSIKTFSKENWERDRYVATMENYVARAEASGRARAAFISVAILTVLLICVFLMWFGSSEIAAGRLTPGEFTSFMFALGFVGSSSGSLAEYFAKFHRVSGASDRLVEILEEEPEPVEETAVAQKFRGRVEFDDVHFAYETRRDAPVLQGLDLTVEAGESVALIGSSGVGKSTIISLLFRLYDTENGEIRIDGRNIQDFSLFELRSQMALVPQEVMLIGGTIRENIAYGRDGATEAEIDEAADLAKVSEFVEELPDGFDTRVGDRGMALSGGQRQRVAIARAILADPAILILDEATSSLDSENEVAVREALDEVMKERTTFVIAHRPASLENVDRIVALADGKVVENGSREELAERFGGEMETILRELAGS